MILDEPSVINEWIRQPGPIKSRRIERTAHTDTKAIEGILLAVLISISAVGWVSAFYKLAQMQGWV